MDNEKDVLSDEEISEEEKVADDNELRDKIVSDLGLTDDDDNKEMIDRLVERETELRKGYGKLLGKYKAVKGQLPKGTPPKREEVPKGDDILKQAQASVRSELDEEFLDDSDYSDEVKEAIRQEAKRMGVSARKASKSEFVQFKLTKEEEAKRILEAGDNGSKKGKIVSDPSKPLDPADFDLSTEEGRKAWDEAKKARRK